MDLGLTGKVFVASGSRSPQAAAEALGVAGVLLDGAMVPVDGGALRSL